MHLIRAQYLEEKILHALFGDASIMVILEYASLGGPKVLIP
jgi:hypothetical protein